MGDLMEKSGVDIVPLMVVLGRAGGGQAWSSEIYQALQKDLALPTDGAVIVGFGGTGVGPDTVVVGFETECHGSELQAVMQDVATRTDWSIAVIRGLGVSEQDIRATECRLSVDSVGHSAPATCADAGVPTYRVVTQIDVTLRDPDLLGGLVTAVVGSGLFNIRSVNLNAEDPRSLIRYQTLLMSLEVKQLGNSDLRWPLKAVSRREEVSSP